MGLRAKQSVQPGVRSKVQQRLRGATDAAVESLERRVMLSTSFAPGVSYATGYSASAVAAGDFNGDGCPDLVVSNSGSYTISVFVNNGNGTFAPKRDYSTAGGPLSLATADFDGDGDVDIAVANSGNASLSVFLNRGDGTFAAKVDYAAGADPQSVIAADFDGDGASDLASVNYSNFDGTFSVLLNRGDATFAAPVSYGIEQRPWAMASGDFNGDGKVDIAAVNAGSNSVSVALNNGDGTFAPSFSYATGGFPFAVTAGDLNGDGYDDLAVSDNFNAINVLLNQGNGSFAPRVNYEGGGSPYSITAADINGDGSSDLVTIYSAESYIGLLENDGDGTFGPRVTYPSEANPRSVISADLNGDGKPDLAVANGFTDTVSVYLNTLTTDFAPRAGVSVPAGIPVGDIAIDYTLVDAESDPCTVNVDFTTDGGLTWQPATAAAGSEATVGLSSSPTGQAHQFIWDSAADIAGNADARLRITPVAGQTGAPSTITLRIRNDNHAPSTSVTLSPQNPKTTAVLTATATKTDSDDDAVSLTFVWKVNGVVKRTFTSATALTDSFSLATAGNGDRNDIMKVTVTPNDGLANGSAATASVTVADTAPVFKGTLRKTVTAGTATAFTPQEFIALFSDADAGDTLQKIKITVLPGYGTLRLAGVAILANQEIPAGQLGSLTYTPRASNPGSDGFGWMVSDGTLYSPAASTAVITIIKLQPTAVLSWTTTPEVQFGQVVRVNAIVSTNSAVLPTGSVQFIDVDNSVLATFSLVNGQVSGQINGMARGYHQLTAKYLGNATYDALSATRPLPIHVGAANVVDVLAIYTDGAEQQIAGYDANIEDVIYMAIADTNDAFINSQIDLSLELSAVLPTTYDESGAFDTDLTRLASPSDGFMDDIFSLRNTYGADLVTLFVGSGDLAGIAYLMQNDLSNADNADLAFSVILAEESIAPYYALAHELGHNFGAVHDRENADNPGYYYDSYGYRYTGSDGILYHDIMSYDPGEMIPYFANPNVSYKGRPTGNSGSNVARTLNATAPIVKQYRPTKVPLTTATSTTLSVAKTGSSATLSARVAELTANPHTPEGTVVFIDGNRRLGEATLSNGQATWTGALPLGVPHSIRAIYQADDFYGDSISAANTMAGDYAVDGTANADVFAVTMNGSLLRVTLNSVLVKEMNVGEIGSMTIRGLAGNDRISVAGTVTKGLILEGGDGSDTLVGGSGNDTLRGNAGTDSMLGNSGNDRIEAGDGNDWAAGGAGADTFTGGLGNDTVYGGPGADSLLGEGNDDLFWGGAGNDTINGGSGNDVAVGELDDDLLIGGDGNDTLAGSYGNDLVSGQIGSDMVLGNAGYDTLFGGVGIDLVDGAGEDDIAYGDEATGYAGDSDKVIGGDGNDTLHGGIGRDTIWGNAGNDALYGDASADQLWGGVGNDALTGGDSSDTLLGEGGDDWLYSAADGAVDWLRGDTGLDHAVRGPSDVLLDVIEDTVLGA